MNKINILIVDDSEMMRRVVKKSLSSVHAEFFEASHGGQALSLVQEQSALEDEIHLILLDWMMPKVTGLQVLTQLRAIEQFKTEPAVIMVTAETYPEQIKSCMELGVNAYITKPFNPNQILSVVQEQIDKILSVKGMRRAV